MGGGSADPVLHLKKVASSILPTVDSLRLALERFRTRIISDTQAGIDRNGTAFIPYERGYARKRDEAGRGSTVDLTFTGQMLAAVQVQVRGSDEVGVGVYAGQQALLAQVHDQGLGHCPKRQWLTPSDRDLQLIAKETIQIQKLRQNTTI